MYITCELRSLPICTVQTAMDTDMVISHNDHDHSNGQLTTCLLHTACKNMAGWWRWALVSPGGVASSRKVGVSASVNLPLHHKVQKFSSGTGSHGWSRRRGHKTVVVVDISEMTFIVIYVKIIENGIV